MTFDKKLLLLFENYLFGLLEGVIIAFIFLCFATSKPYISDRLGLEIPGDLWLLVSLLVPVAFGLVASNNIHKHALKESKVEESERYAECLGGLSSFVPLTVFLISRFS